MLNHQTGELTDAELIQRCMDAPTDEVVLEQFFSRFYGFIRMEVLREVSRGKFHEHIVDDLVQDVCRKALFAIRQKAFRAPLSIRAYLRVMIKSSIVDYVRSKEYKSHVSFDEQIHVMKNVAPDPLEQMSLEEDRMLLEDAKKTLSKTERQIVDMLLNGLSASEIAHQLNIGIDSVYSLKSRSFKKLRAYIKKS